MVFINIPYVPENNRVDKLIAEKEIAALDISESAKLSVFTAIYNLHPRGVTFGADKLREVQMLESSLHRLGIPYRREEELDY